MYHGASNCRGFKRIRGPYDIINRVKKSFFDYPTRIFVGGQCSMGTPSIFFLLEGI